MDIHESYQSYQAYLLYVNNVKENYKENTKKYRKGAASADLHNVLCHMQHCRHIGYLLDTSAYSKPLEHFRAQSLGEFVFQLLLFYKLQITIFYLASKIHIGVEYG